MTKWLIFVIVPFFGLWIFYKHDFPGFIRESRIGDFMDIVSPQIEDKLHKQFPSSFPGLKYPEVYKISYDQIKKFKQDTDANSRKVVYYLYSPGAGFYNKLSMAAINRVIKDIPSEKHDVDYLFIAVSDDKNQVSDFLSGVPKPNFIPYYIDVGAYNSVLMMFEKENIYPNTELPKTVFKKVNRSDYIEVESGYFTSGRLQDLILGEVYE